MKLKIVTNPQIIKHVGQNTYYLVDKIVCPDESVSDFACFFCDLNYICMKEEPKELMHLCTMGPNRCHQFFRDITRLRPWEEIEDDVQPTSGK